MKKPPKTAPVTYDTVRQFALTLPNVEEGTSYTTPALKVKGKLFVRLKEDGETIAIKTSFEEREELMAADPETYYITDHYLHYDWVLVNLKKVSEAALRDLLRGAHRLAQPRKNE